MAITLKAAAYQQFQTRGASYTADANGFLTNVAVGDVVDLLNGGAILVSSLSNLAATVDPAITDDNTKGYSVASRWFNTSSGQIFEMVSAATGAAVWVPLVNRTLGKLIGANMNVTTDQAIRLFVPATAKFRVTKITTTNASISLTTAAGGIYPAASKGGTAIVGSAQAYSGLTAAAKAVDLTLANTDVQPAATLLYLALTTAQGAAATADIYVYGDILI